MIVDNTSRGWGMSQKFLSSESDVLGFLSELTGVLTDLQFNLDTDLDILLNRNQNIQMTRILLLTH